MTPRSRKVVWFVTGNALAVLALLVLFALVTSATKSTEIRDTQEMNSPLIANSNETLELIQSCTTPGMECYERGQAQTGEAVANINRVVILAAVCASGDEEKTVKEIESCVVAGLAEMAPTAGGKP